MLKINFESEANYNEDQKRCACKKKTNQQLMRKRNAQDSTEAIIQVMILCGIPEYKAKSAMDILVKSLTFFEEIYYRVDRIPRKRFCKEDLMYRASCFCQFSRKETQLTFAITRRVFRALYFNTRQCGEIINANIQRRHSQECVFVHAAKRIAQILAAIEGMFYETQIMFEKRIKCIFKLLLDKIKQRVHNAPKCECLKCLREEQYQSISNFKLKNKQGTSSSTSSMGMPDQQLKFCSKVCEEKRDECKMLKSYVSEEEAPEEEEENYDIFEKCNCPKLTCDPYFESEFRVPSLESSQGPFVCHWIPMSVGEDICDDICGSQSEKQDACAEVKLKESSQQESDIVCHKQICEEEYGTPFYDDFDEGTISLTVSQPSCHIFRCTSDTSFKAEFETEATAEEDSSNKLVQDHEKPSKEDKQKNPHKKRPARDNVRVSDQNIFDDKEKSDKENERTGKGRARKNNDKSEKDMAPKSKLSNKTIDGVDEQTVKKIDNTNKTKDPTAKKIEQTDQPGDHTAKKVKQTDKPGDPTAKKVEETNKPEDLPPKGKQTTDQKIKPPEKKTSETKKTDREQPEKGQKTETDKTPVKSDKATKKVAIEDKPKPNSPQGKKTETKTETKSDEDTKKINAEDKRKTQSPQDKRTETKTETPTNQVDKKHVVDKPEVTTGVPTKRPSRGSRINIDNKKKNSTNTADITKVDKKRKGVTDVGTRRSTLLKSDVQIKKQIPKKPFVKNSDRNVEQKRYTLTPRRSTKPEAGRTKTTTGRKFVRVGDQILPCCVCPKHKKKFIGSSKCNEEPSIYYPFED